MVAPWCPTTGDFSSLFEAGDWVRKGSYSTAWSVPWDSRVLVRTRVGKALLSGIHWRAMLAIIHAEWRPCTVDASGCSFSQRCSHFDAGHYFKSSVHGSLRQFSLRRAAFFGALHDEELFIIEGSCQFTSIGCCHRHRCVRSRQQPTTNNQ